MPNWCECELYVSRIEDRKSSSEELQRFKGFAKEGEGADKCVLSTERFIPYPDKFKEMDKAQAAASEEWERSKPEGFERLSEEERCKWLKQNPSPWQKGIKDGFNSGGYIWCVLNWGTKWGICNPCIAHENESELQYEFECAWSPPLQVILKMSELFPLLEFELRYFECGCGFNGRFVCQDGVVTDEEEGVYFGRRGG